jgi:two-component sensor histidine kinase
LLVVPIDSVADKVLGTISIDYDSPHQPRQEGVDAVELLAGPPRGRHTFTMSWTERDGPPVSVSKRRGFGITVIETMATHCPRCGRP